MATKRTIDDAALSKLLTRARREVDDGLLPSCQVALAYENELVAFEALGDATIDTRYCVFSATKPFVAGAMWALIGDGLLDVTKRVAEYVPSFGANGKGAVTVEQVMLHTSGFPHAPLGPPAWSTRETRRQTFEKWRLNWEPGSCYEYHATSAHWVLAEIVDVVTGGDYRDIVEQRVTTPAGLPRVLGLAPEQQQGIAPLRIVGEEAGPAEIRAAFGVEALPPSEVTPEALLRFDDPDIRALGVPGGGGYMRACDLALFYQAVLHNPGEMWRPDVLDDARSNVRNRLPERWFGYPANRTLGLFQAGDDAWANVRGFGRTSSPQTIGHNGAGGQLAWADPATGLSFGYTTNGMDQHKVREPRRGTALSSLAAMCRQPA